MEACVHVGAPTPLPAGSMDGSDGLGRPVVAGAYRHLGMAGYSASTLDLFRAHGFSPTRAFTKTEFGRRRACTRGNHNWPCHPGVRCDGVSDLLSHLYAAQCRPRPGRPRTLLRHCSANGCYLPRLDDKYRFTSWRTRDDGDHWIIAFGNYEFQSTARGTLVSAVSSSARSSLVAACLDPHNAETILRVVEGDALDETRQHFPIGWYGLGLHDVLPHLTNRFHQEPCRDTGWRRPP